MKRKELMKKKKELKVIIAIVMIISTLSSMAIFGLLMYYNAHFSLYKNDALLLPIVNFVAALASVVPFVYGIIFCSRLWKKGKRRINKMIKDALD